MTNELNPLTPEMNYVLQQNSVEKYDCMNGGVCTNCGACYGDSSLMADL